MEARDFSRVRFHSLDVEERYQRELQRYHIYTVAAEENDILGLTWNEMTDTDESDCEIVALYVRYKQRKNGIGKILFKDSVDFFRASGKKKMIIWCLKENYEAKGNVTVEDIIALHAEFEYIHPFQDGNGRVGRLVALKECLRHSVIPFIIEDAKKNYYYRGLSEWRNEKGWLTDTCLDGQDTFKRLMDMLEIQY